MSQTSIVSQKTKAKLENLLQYIFGKYISEQKT